jgi:ferredoxin
MATELPAPRSCFECVNCVSVCVAGALETCVVDLFGQPVERRGAEDLDSEDENVLCMRQLDMCVDMYGTMYVLMVPHCRRKREDGEEA